MGREERHTIGTRFFGTLDHWDFNHEAVYQFGRFGSGDISAWSVATDHGYTFDNMWGKPRLGLKAAIASGDRNPQSANLQTLNPLFPRGNYFTEASLLGPQNFVDIHPSVRLQPSATWSVDLGSDFYWRESLDDGIYTPVTIHGRLHPVVAYPLDGPSDDQQSLAPGRCCEVTSSG